MSIVIKKSSNSKLINVVNTETNEILTASIVKSPMKDGKVWIEMIINTTKSNLPEFSMGYRFHSMDVSKISVTCDLVDNFLNINFIVEGYQSSARYSFVNSTVRRCDDNPAGRITYQDMINEFLKNTSGNTNALGDRADTISLTVPANESPVHPNYVNNYVNADKISSNVDDTLYMKLDKTVSKNGSPIHPDYLK